MTEPNYMILFDKVDAFITPERISSIAPQISMRSARFIAGRICFRLQEPQLGACETMGDVIQKIHRKNLSQFYIGDQSANILQALVHSQGFELGQLDIFASTYYSRPLEKAKSRMQDKLQEREANKLQVHKLPNNSLRLTWDVHVTDTELQKLGLSRAFLEKSSNDPKLHESIKNLVVGYAATAQLKKDI